MDDRRPRGERPLTLVSARTDGQSGLVSNGVIGYLADQPVCNAVPLHRLSETAHDNDRGYVTSQADIDNAKMAPSGYDDGKPYADDGVIGYVWTTL